MIVEYCICPINDGIDHEIKEHLIQPTLSQCLKGKRIAMRDTAPSDRVQYKCIKSKANIEIYMGQLKKDYSLNT